MFGLKKSQWVAIALIVACITMRSYITIPNFTPMLGASVVAGMVLSGPLAVVVPVVSMVASDVVLFLKQSGGANSMDFWSWMSFQPVIYLLMALSVVIGRAGRGVGNNLVSGTLMGVSSSVVFFVLSNLMVWLDPWGWAMYPHTTTGLIQCFMMALPFFTPTFVSTVLFVPIFLGLNDLIRNRLDAPKQYKLGL